MKFYHTNSRTWKLERWDCRFCLDRSAAVARPVKQTSAITVFRILHCLEMFETIDEWTLCRLLQTYVMDTPLRHDMNSHGLMINPYF